MSPPLAHIAGVPVEEGLLALPPAGMAIGALVAVVARARVAKLVAWLRRR